MDKLTKAAKKILNAKTTVMSKYGYWAMVVPVKDMTALGEAVKGLPQRSKLPMSVGQIRQAANENGWITFVAEFELSELMVNIDLFNNLVSEWLSGGDDTCLENICCEMLGVKDGNLLMQVKGNVKNWLARNGEEPKETMKLCVYHANSLGWDECSSGTIGCQVEEARKQAKKARVK